MATRKSPKDPAAAANEQVLAQRQARIDKQLREIPDLGLEIEEKATTAAEFIRDEFDKKAFGEDPKTVTRVVYGPDPLLDNCPQFREALEKNGKDDFAEATRRAILRYEHRAVPDPIMQKGLYKAIRKFGKEQVAQAFADRILKIPSREVEYELDSGDFGDPMLLGSNALQDCVTKYGEPGKAYKFLSQRCMDVLGMRGYTLVTNERGDPVKAGTLFMAWIPQHVADARRARFAKESEDQVAAQQDEYMETADRLVRQAGKVGAGSRPLNPNEMVRAAAAENQEMLGNEYEMGLKLERGA